jgi:hypothetical protein
MTHPDDDKATPQIQPDMPAREDEPEIEDPEIRSGHLADRPQGTDPDEDN